MSQAETRLPYSRPDFAEIDRTGELTLEHIRYFTETLGADKLPKMEGGTKKTSDGEPANLQARIDYLKTNLGIDLSTYPKPRLMADVMTDLITLCQTLTHEFGPDDDPQLLIDNLNALMRFRQTKAALMDHLTSSGKTYRQAGLDWEHSPGRSDNPLKPGAYKSILELLESALISKSASTQSFDTIS